MKWLFINNLKRFKLGAKEDDWDFPAGVQPTIRYDDPEDEDLFEEPFIEDEPVSQPPPRQAPQAEHIDLPFETSDPDLLSSLEFEEAEEGDDDLFRAFFGEEELQPKKRIVIQDAPKPTTTHHAIEEEVEEEIFEDDENELEQNQLNIMSLAENLPARLKVEVKQLVDMYQSILNLHVKDPTAALRQAGSFLPRAQFFSANAEDMYDLDNDLIEKIQAIQNNLNNLIDNVNPIYQNVIKHGLPEDITKDIFKLKQYVENLFAEMKKSPQERDIDLIKDGWKQVKRFKRQIYQQAKQELPDAIADDIDKQLAEITSELDNTVPAALKAFRLFGNMSAEAAEQMVANLRKGLRDPKVKKLYSKFLSNETITQSEKEYLAQLYGLEVKDLEEIEEFNRKEAANPTLLSKVEELQIELPNDIPLHADKVGVEDAGFHVKQTTLLDEDQFENMDENLKSKFEPLIQQAQSIINISHPKARREALVDIMAPLVTVVQEIIENYTVRDELGEVDYFRETFGEFIISLYKLVLDTDDFESVKNEINTSEFDTIIGQIPQAKSDEELEQERAKRKFARYKWKNREKTVWVEDPTRAPRLKGNQLVPAKKQVPISKIETPEARAIRMKEKEEIAERLKSHYNIYTNRQKIDAPLFFSYRNKINKLNSMIRNAFKAGNQIKADRYLLAREDFIQKMLPSVEKELSKKTFEKNIAENWTKDILRNTEAEIQELAQQMLRDKYQAAVQRNNKRQATNLLEQLQELDRAPYKPSKHHFQKAPTKPEPKALTLDERIERVQQDLKNPVNDSLRSLLEKELQQLLQERKRKLQDKFIEEMVAKQASTPPARIIRLAQRRKWLQFLAA